MPHLKKKGNSMTFSAVEKNLLHSDISRKPHSKLSYNTGEIKKISNGAMPKIHST